MSQLLVIKVGGSLAADPPTLGQVATGIAALGRSIPLIVIPGGGPFADTVREIDDRFSLPSSAAHWMAILGMDQYAHLLAALIPGGEVVVDQSEIGLARAAGKIPVLAPSQWLAAADELPHSWDVTSDSLAAYLAMLLGAERLVLVKSTESGSDLLDPYFSRVVPEGLPWRVVGPEGLGSLPDWIRKSA